MTLSFTLTPEQEQLKKGAREFAEQLLATLATAVRDEAGPFTHARLARPVFEQAVAAGLLKGLIPAPFGGQGVGGVEVSILIEEWACRAPTSRSRWPVLIALAPGYEAGTPEQVQCLVDTGAPVAAMVYSERDGSADFDAEPPAEGTRTTAVLDGDHRVINGCRAWASTHPGGLLAERAATPTVNNIPSPNS